MAEDIARTIDELTAALDAERRRWTEAQPHVQRGRFFDAIFRDMRDGVVILDPQTVVLDVNPAFCAMTGFAREDLIGATPPYPHWAPEDWETDEDSLAHGVRGELRSRVMTLRRKDGARFHALLTPSVVRREDGSTIAVFSTFKDLTERELDQQALRESGELHRSIVSSAQEAIFVQERSGRIIAWNEAAARIFGIDAATATAQPRGVALMPGWRAIREDGSPLSPQELASHIAITTGQPQAGMVVGFARGDEVRWIEGSATPLFSEDEELPYAVVSICTDITERRRREEEVRRLNAQLAGRVASATEQRDALNRELEAYAYSIAHDVRAPLRAIDGFSAVVLEADGERLSEEGATALHRVRLAAQRLARLLDDLMGLSHVSQRDLLRRAVDVSALATEVGEELAADNSARFVRLVVQPGMAARADKALVRLALRELLGNSWKFTRPHAEATVEVGTLDQDGETVFFVRDDGVGFDMRFADHLFGAFQRMHSSDQFTGDGIGLATVQRLVIRHDGRIWAESAVEQGATFYFTLQGRETTQQ